MIDWNDQHKRSMFHLEKQNSISPRGTRVLFIRMRILNFCKQSKIPDDSFINSLRGWGGQNNSR